jgi:ribosomal protein S18 acetylase RimI-like enzyme
MSNMLQSSITAWLKKPPTVMKADQLPTAAAPPPMPPARQAQLPASRPERHAAPTRDHASEPAPKLPPALFSTPPLPENVELAPLTQELIPSFKRILSLTLPVSYPAVFFTEAMEEPFHSITLMALWHPAPLNDGVSVSSTEKPRLVGAIRCRILPSANLYISTISLLAPYRSHGIATHLLQRIAAKAVELHGVRCVTAHVWEANEDGLEWYRKRGFDIIGKEDAYYHKLKPQGAILVRKWIGVADLLAHPDAVSVVER